MNAVASLDAHNQHGTRTMGSNQLKRWDKVKNLDYEQPWENVSTKETHL